MTIDDLCQKALAYILTINPGNFNKEYTQTGYLAPNGSILKYFDKYIYYNGGGYQAGRTFRQYVRTSETIATNYRTQITSTSMTNHWNNFKNTYINSVFVNTNKPISLSSFLVFIYLFRCFIDTRFKLFTDSYNLAYVWLYNTNESVNYNINTSILPLDISNTELSVSNMQTYLNVIIDEIISKDTIDILDSVLTSGWI